MIASVVMVVDTTAVSALTVSISIRVSALASDNIMTTRVTASIALLIIILAISVMYLLDFIVVGCYGDEIIVAVVEAVNSIIHHAVIIYLVGLKAVVVTIKAEDKSGKEMHIQFE